MAHDSEKSPIPLPIEDIHTVDDVVVVDDFDWNFNVIVNLLALYTTFLAATWQLFALPISLGFIGRAFPQSIDKLAWIAAVLSLVQCVLSLFVGELSDIFGRRWFIIVGNLSLLVGGIVACRGTSVNMIIGGQAITGIGVTLGYLTTPLLAEAVPKRSRSFIIAIASGGIGILASLGTLVVGAFTKYDIGGVNQGWRMGGYVGSAIAFVALLLTFFFYYPGHRPNPEGLSVSIRLRKIDWIGIVIGCSALTLILLGLQFGGSTYPWGSSRVLGLLVTGCACLVIFVVWEVKFVAFGLFPRAIFQHRNFAIVLAIQFVEGVGVNTAAAFLTQVQYYVFTSDALMVQVRCLPSGCFTLVGAAVAAGIMYKTRETKWVLIGAVSFGTIAPGLFSIVQPDSSFVRWVFPCMFLGSSVAAMGVAVSVIATLCTPNELIATALALCGSVRGLGGAVGVVAFSQILAAKVKVYLPAQVAAGTVAAGLPPTSIGPLLLAFASGDSASLQTVPGVTPQVFAALDQAVKQAYADSFRWMWYAMIPFFGVALLLTLTLKPTKPLTTQEVASSFQQRYSSKRQQDNAQETPASKEVLETRRSEEIA